MFFGSGTTGRVARKLSRNFIGIELNENYINLAEQRINEPFEHKEEQIQGQMSLEDFIERS